MVNGESRMSGTERLREAEVEIWADTERSFDRLGGYLSMWGYDMPDASLETVYREAVCLAANLERLMAARGMGYV